jgi:hypothetical protein
MSEQQEMMNIIGGLTLETSVMSLVLIHLISREVRFEQRGLASCFR